jgi:hypothetical protein
VKLSPRLFLAFALLAAMYSTCAQSQLAGGDQGASSQQYDPSTIQGAQQDPAGAFASDPQTQDALAFTGRVIKENGQVKLMDPVTKVNYQLDNQSKAKQFVGRRVKVIGTLGLNSNTIFLHRIEPLS